MNTTTLSRAPPGAPATAWFPYCVPLAEMEWQKPPHGSVHLVHRGRLRGRHDRPGHARARAMRTTQQMSAADRASFDPTYDAFPARGWPVVACALGALAITTEFSTGMIRATFAAVPRRPPARREGSSARPSPRGGEISAFAAFSPTCTRPWPCTLAWPARRAARGADGRRLPSADRAHQPGHRRDHPAHRRKAICALFGVVLLGLALFCSAARRRRCAHDEELADRGQAACLLAEGVRDGRARGRRWPAVIAQELGCAVRRTATHRRGPGRRSSEDVDHAGCSFVWSQVGWAQTASS